MAISFVGSDADAAPNGVNITRNLPVGVAQGDACYTTLGISKNSNINLSMNTSGYTELCDIYTNGTNDINLGCYRKLQGASPDATAVANGSGNSADCGTMVLYVLRGVNQTTPEDAMTTTATGTGSAATNPPSITTVTANAWVLACGGVAGVHPTGTGTPTAPTNYTNLDFENGSDDSGSNGAHMSSRLIASAGAENPGAYSGMTGNSWAAASIAVRPASGPSPITAGAGSYAFTGTAATLRKGKILTADAGAMAFNGQAATLKRAAKAVAGAGSYAFGGQTAALLHKKILTAAPGAYAFTGTAATLRRNLPLIAGATSYAFTGQTAGLVHAWKIVAAAGSMAFNGQAVTLARALKVTAGAGAYTLTGQDAALVTAANQAIIAGVGGYSFSGAPAALLQVWKVAAGAGSYALNGQNAALVRRGKLTAKGGGYNLAGVDASLVWAPAPQPIVVHRPGAWDPRQEEGRRQRELDWQLDLKRIIDQAWRIANGEIDPITLEPIPPPDFDGLASALQMIEQARDQAAADAMMAAEARRQEEEAIAVLLLAA